MEANHKKKSLCDTPCNGCKPESRVNRRRFLKTSALAAGIGTAAAGFGTAAAFGSPGRRSEFNSLSLFVKRYRTIDDAYEIAVDYQRMDQKNTVFSRAGWDAPFARPKGQFYSFLGKKSGKIPNPLESLPGYSKIDHALERAAEAGHKTGAWLSIVGIRGKGEMNDWKTFSNPETREPYRFDSQEEASGYVKRAAAFLGADEVGIAPYDERWVYGNWFDIEPLIFHNKEPVHEHAVFPFQPKSVIAVSFEMDYDALKAPGHIAGAAVQLGYSRMAEVTHKLAVFLNRLGYKAIPSGNDTGLNIPVAIQAGLGELSRMGTLISPKYGSRVRLAKVYTDLELKPDQPITFGVQAFCKKCKKCADQCPSNAISLDDEPSPHPTVDSISSHPGVTKWFQHNERCFSQWEKLGMGCNICVSVCPYNKLNTWVHDVSKIAVGLPVGRDIARILDDGFGYGEISPKNVDAFWNKS